MNKETIKEFMPLMQAILDGKTIQYYSEWRRGWVDTEEILVDGDVPEYRIKPEVTSDNNPSVSTSEYHLECFDNGYTIAEEVKVCAVGDDDTKKHLGEFIFADLIHHCNLTCSNKVKITVKIESED